MYFRGRAEGHCRIFQYWKGGDAKLAKGADLANMLLCKFDFPCPPGGNQTTEVQGGVEWVCEGGPFHQRNFGGATKT